MPKKSLDRLRDIEGTVATEHCGIPMDTDIELYVDP
jgi:hypothetical protein